MSWVKIDDGMPDHRKWASLEASPRAWADCMAVWVAVACYAARTLSDGYADTARIVRLTPLGKGAIKACDALVEAGLMVKEGAGYRIHDWTKYNPPAAKIVADREAEAARKAEKRGSKKQGTYEECPPRTEGRTSDRTPRRTQERTAEQTETRTPERTPDTPRARNSRPLPTPPQETLRVSGAHEVSDLDEPIGGRWPTDLDEPVEVSEESLLRVGYQRRYEREVGDAWMRHARDDEHVKRAAAWARTQPDPKAAVERFLDGAFTDVPRRDGQPDSWRTQRWPWRWIAEDPGRTAARIEHAAAAAKATSGAEAYAKRPELEQREAVAYERAVHRLKGEWAPERKPWEAEYLARAIAKGWDPEADLRAEGWTPGASQAVTA